MHELKNKLQLILASQSPRRKELLGWLEIPFLTIPSNAEENSNASDSSLVVKEHTLIKGRDVFSKRSGNVLVVSSDTVVEISGEILGKPKSKVESREHILKLANKTHQVHTGVAILARIESEIFEHYFEVISKVTFDEIDEGLLEDYIECGEGMDKAGAYGIQGRALSFISYLEGSYSNVVGFPLSDFVRELKSFIECHIELNQKNWRSVFKSV